MSRFKSSSTTRTLQHLVHSSSSSNKSNVAVRNYCNNHKEDDHEDAVQIEKLTKEALKDDRFLDPRFYNEVDSQYSAETLKKFHKRLVDSKLLDVAHGRRLASTMEMYEKLDLLEPEKTMDEEALDSDHLARERERVFEKLHKDATYTAHIKGIQAEMDRQGEEGEEGEEQEGEEEGEEEDQLKKLEQEQDEDELEEKDGEEDGEEAEEYEYDEDEDLDEEDQQTRLELLTDFYGVDPVTGKRNIRPKEYLGDVTPEDPSIPFNPAKPEMINEYTELHVDGEEDLDRDSQEYIHIQNLKQAAINRNQDLEDIIKQVEDSEHIPRGLFAQHFRETWISNEEGREQALEEYLNENMNTPVHGEETLGILTRLQFEAALASVNALYNARMEVLGIKPPVVPRLTTHEYEPLKYVGKNRSAIGREPHYVENNDTFDYSQSTSPNTTAAELEEIEAFQGVDLPADPEFDAQFSQWMRERFIYKHKILNQLAMAKTYEQIDNDNVRESLSRSIIEPTEDDPLEVPMTDAELENAIRDMDGRVIPEELLDDRDRYNYLLRKYKNPAAIAAKEAKEREQRRAAMDTKKREIDGFLEGSAKFRRAMSEEERLETRDDVDRLLGADINIQKYKVNPKLEQLREKHRLEAVKEKSSHEYLHRQIHRMEKNGQLGNAPLYSATTGKEVTGNPKFPKCLLCYDFGWRVEPLNVPLLSIYMNTEGDILPRYITGNCLKHQKRLARNIKAAKHLGFFSYKSGTFTIYDPNVVPPTPAEEKEYLKYYKGAYTPKEWMDGDTRLQWEDDESNESLYAESEEEIMLHKEALMLDLGISEAEAKEILSGKLENDGKELLESTSDSLDNPINQ
ncbi:hypothetical protein DFA_01684 [Cavenderia fasciculata]|uniref:Ribosomal protein S18 n=1 Tax=Cavenderia fasciculata TaxID=261658 RepID=F4PU83_CACFS|nr:uncharacterized protein DFA_01684 [Cavenderia fasciculata]EGG21798.1 hypothetical protein DFA_01684 [Cavenderia fasciculata]|eukprot:XP_004359648.1 hypothetical protein DFA_01684 [Cavenderia fasciculata]